MKESPEKNSEQKKEILYEIPVAGSLGLLALGAKGLDLWRKKKEELKKSEKRPGDEKE